jgi:hypothetical protein
MRLVQRIEVLWNSLRMKRRWLESRGTIAMANKPIRRYWGGIGDQELRTDPAALSTE